MQQISLCGESTGRVPLVKFKFQVAFEMSNKLAIVCLVLGVTAHVAQGQFGKFFVAFVIELSFASVLLGSLRMPLKCL